MLQIQHLRCNICFNYLSACRALACRTPWHIKLALFTTMITALITMVTKVITKLHMSAKQHKVLATQAIIQVTCDNCHESSSSELFFASARCPNTRCYGNRSGPYKYSSSELSGKCCCASALQNEVSGILVTSVKSLVRVNCPLQVRGDSMPVRVPR